MIFLPDKCIRGYDYCTPLSLIDSYDGTSFFCCGENDGSKRKLEQDKYTLCFKNSDMDTETHNDKRDLTHQLSVIAQALAIIEEQEDRL